VARELFLDKGGGGGGAGGRIGAFCPENKRFPKKRSSPDLQRFLVPKMAQDIDLRGAKIAQGGQNISRGGSCPSAPLLPAAMNQFQFYDAYQILS